MALPPGYADSVHEYSNHADQLLQHLRELRKISRLHDVVLKLSDGEWRAHKCVLSAYSGFFRTLFVTSGSHEKEVKLKTLRCKGIGPLLEYMYTGRLELVEENVMEVFCTAGYLQVFGVLGDISKFMSNTTLPSQQGRHGNGMDYNLINDGIDREEMYNESPCDTVSLQQELRSQSPDSGTQSGEELRTEEEMAVTSISGNNFEVLAAQMSQMTADAFAQALSLDLTYNGQNATLVDSPVIMDANGLPSMVVLDQGTVEQFHVDQPSIAMQVDESSLEGEARMGEIHVNSSEQVSDSTTAGENATCAMPPVLDVGTAADEANADSKEQHETRNDKSVNLAVKEIDVHLSERKEGQVEHQGKCQNATGGESQSAEVDRAGDEPKTIASDGDDGTTTAPNTDLPKKGKQKRKVARKTYPTTRKRTRKSKNDTTVAGENEVTVILQKNQQDVVGKNNNEATKRRRKLKNDPYLCNICGEELQTSGKLRTHMANHEGGKKYECPICLAKFGYSNHLADHMRIHTGERPYKCDQCDANFKQMSTLIRHTRRHTGQMPYRCAVCNLGFHDTTHLKLHLKTHAKVYKEPEEEFTFTVIAKGTTIGPISLSTDPSCLLSTDPSCLSTDPSC
ncbi:ZSCAN2 [Branchiostoma lanceolatum]|uniref:ZSCAN2 protein n=1 Tax=Branchiostoma lanceolatum TaxID=7740 RepID=A0A8J9YTS3_BRALA|nr:ZSCAN2 [Branchiostoma lanceolatum]